MQFWWPDKGKKFGGREIDDIESFLSQEIASLEKSPHVLISS